MNHHKKIIIITIMLIFSATFTSLPAAPTTNQRFSFSQVTEQQAYQIATNKLAIEQIHTHTITDTTPITDHTGTIIAYLNILDPIGYIVVPTYKILPPILVHSFTNAFGQLNQDNILLKIIQTDITLRLTHHTKMSETHKTSQQSLWTDYLSNKDNIEPTGTLVGPLLDTNWHQNAPYKNFCPIDLGSGTRSIAGCPAVAMAQILNYHNTTMNIQFTDADDYYHNYAGNSYWIDNDHITYDFPDFPTLNTYLNTLQTHYDQSIPLTDDDKAAITFACGVAAKQVYNPGGSGTFGVSQAYNAYLRFGFENISLLDENDPNVYDRLQDNMLNGLPAHIAVVNDQWTVGHNMVVDGYHTDGSFHINFGWGGSYNGWYQLPHELPYDLTVLEGLVLDIDVPTNESTPNLDGGGIITLTDIKPGSTITENITITNIGDPESLLNWEITDHPNWGTWTFTPDQGTGLTPEDGDQIIQITLVIPEEKNKQFNGQIKIINQDDPNDICYVQLSIKTPKIFDISDLLTQFFNNHPLIHHLIQAILIF